MRLLLIPFPTIPPLAGIRRLHAPHTSQFGTEKRCTTFASDHPRPADKRRLVAHVLAVAAFQLRNPVRFLVTMEAGDPARRARAISECHRYSPASPAAWPDEGGKALRMKWRRDPGG